MPHLTPHERSVIFMADAIFAALNRPPILKPTSNWDPLIKLVGEVQADDYMLMGSTGDVIHFKHRMTRRYLNIHRVTGETYQRTVGVIPSGYEPVPVIDALAHVRG